MSNFGPDSLFLPHRVWKVKFIGESVDDCGGGYSESIAEMCDELQNGSLPLLIVTPNGREESGANRDCLILSPEACSPVHLNMFKFFGVLIGIAIRTGSPLSLNLAEPVWQQLAGERFASLPHGAFHGPAYSDNSTNLVFTPINSELKQR